MPISISTDDIITRYSTPRAEGPLRIDYPFLGRGDSSHVLLSQGFVVTHSGYSPLALNTAYPDSPFTSCVFVGDGNFGEKPGGLRTFTRQWANLPEDYSEPTTVSYTMPGLLDIRDSFSTVTKGIYDYEFFLVGTGQTYATFDAIPFIDEDKAEFDSGGPYSLGAGSFFLNDGGAGVDTSAPSATTYLGYVSDDASTPTSYSIIAEPSSLERYLGNIWVRKTLKIKAI